MEAIRSIEKIPNKEVVYQCLGHWDVGDPGDKVFMHFGIVKSETPKGRKVPPWGQLSANQRVRIRGIGNFVEKCFSTFETL
jgi:hypothetical protein